MNRPLELEEVKRAIRKMQGGKATGTDGIKIEMIKEMGAVGEQALWKLFIEIWEEETFPENWTQGIVVPIPKGTLKGGAELNPMNYRGITLMNIVPKLYTSIVYDRLSEYCESQGVLAEEQAGFRKLHSTIDQLFTFYEVIKGRVPAKTYCCFLDIEKAYDRTWRDGLWYLLQAKGVKEKCGGY